MYNQDYFYAIRLKHLTLWKFDAWCSTLGNARIARYARARRISISTRLSQKNKFSKCQAPQAFPGGILLKDSKNTKIIDLAQLFKVPPTA